MCKALDGRDADAASIRLDQTADLLHRRSLGTRDGGATLPSGARVAVGAQLRVPGEAARYYTDPPFAARGVPACVPGG
jgi:hypothetical protein